MKKEITHLSIIIFLLFLFTIGISLPQYAQAQTLPPWSSNPWGNNLGLGLSQSTSDHYHFSYHTGCYPFCHSLHAAVYRSKQILFSLFINDCRDERSRSDRRFF